MPIDREATLRQAERLKGQGRLDLAIAEYVRLVEDQPRDWNTINALGDLYLRAGDTDRAVAQFVLIADHLFGEGFFPKAAAVYKKALKSRRGVVLSSDATRVAFTWEGIETNPLLLDAARDAVTALAQMHAPSSSPYR